MQQDSYNYIYVILLSNGCCSGWIDVKICTERSSLGTIIISLLKITIIFRHSVVHLYFDNYYNFYTNFYK